MRLPAVGLGIGVTVGCLCACNAEIFACVTGLVIAAGLLIAAVLRRKMQFYAAGLLVGIVSMTVCRFGYFASLERLAGTDISADCHVVSVGYSDERWSAGRAFCILDGIPALIDISGDAALQTGDSISAELHIEKAERNIFTFSDGVVISGEINRLNSRSSGASMLRLLETLRNTAARRFEIIGGDEAELCKGLILGMKSGFSMRLKRDVLYSGVNYMTAVSGAHITIFLTLLSRLVGKRGRRKDAWLSIAAAVLMMAMFGFTASVVRSGIMMIIMQMGALNLRKNETINSLCATLLIMELFTPFAAADPGLQMSALGVFGAAVAGPQLNRLKKFRWERHIVPAKIKEAAVLSFCAMVCVLPVSVSAFGGFSLAEIPASVALTPFFCAALPLGVIYAVSGIPGLDIPLKAVMVCFRAILGFFGGMTEAWLPCDDNAITIAALLAPVLLSLAIFLSDHCKAAFSAFVLDIILVLCLCMPNISLRQRIDFVSDGSSGAAVIYSGRNAAVLISGKSACAKQLSELLIKQGISSIQLVNAPQLELSGLLQLRELTGIIPADTLMLPAECTETARGAGIDDLENALPALEMMEVNGSTFACVQVGSDTDADIALYYGYKRSVPQTNARLALFASSRQNELPDGGINIHDDDVTIELNQRRNYV